MLVQWKDQHRQVLMFPRDNFLINPAMSILDYISNFLQISFRTNIFQKKSPLLKAGLSFGKINVKIAAKRAIVPFET